MNRTNMARYVGVAAAVASAILYVLIGFEMLYIGEPTANSADGGLLGFGLGAGAAFAIIAVVLLFSHRRLLTIPFALFDAAVIAMYFAVASVREPPYEMPGLIIKALQVVLLGALLYLVARAPGRQAQRHTVPGTAH